MPIVTSDFNPAYLFSNPDLQTILPALFRWPQKLAFKRERILTSDLDFLDLDWLRAGSNKLVILSHGMEGSTQSSYIHGIGNLLLNNGFDILAWNFRGCSGEPNKLKRFYNSGASEDLGCVINHVLKQDNYNELSLVGVSVGGNITLKYLGEQGGSINPKIKKGFALSVPCDLADSARKMALKRNWIYMRRFLNDFYQKMISKQKVSVHMFDLKNYSKIKTFQEFDDRYTAPLNGFSCAEEYWAASSCKQFLKSINVPTLLLSALDDPFLAPACYPFEEAQQNSQFFFEAAKHGGHVGFFNFNRERMFWAETRVLNFLNKDL